MNPLGLVLGGAALVGVGVWIGAHLQGRRIHHPRDLEQIAHLAGQLVTAEEVVEQYREAIASFPERMQRAYDAGQGAMLEQLTGLQAAEPWVPVPPPKWARLIEARENQEAN